MKRKNSGDNNVKRRIVANAGMYMDGDTFWFVGDNDNILYRMKVPEMFVERIAVLPWRDSSSYRVYPRCIKKNNFVYCIPDRGKCIQIYDIAKDSFQQIAVGSTTDGRLAITNFWIDEEKMWCFSYGWNQIIEVNLKEIENIIDADSKKCGLERGGVNVITPIMLKNKIEDPKKAFVFIYTLGFSGMSQSTIINILYDIGISQFYAIMSEERQYMAMYTNAWMDADRATYYREHFNLSGSNSPQLCCATN